jgi:hypothetical protein
MAVDPVALHLEQLAWMEQQLLAPLPEPLVFQGLPWIRRRVRRVAKRPVRKGLVPRRSKLRRR